MFPRMYYIIALIAAIVLYMYMTKKWIFKPKKVDPVIQEQVVSPKEESLSQEEKDE